MNLTKDKILKTLQDHHQEIHSLGVKRLGLFGSAVRGKLKPQSDLDFLVDLRQKTFDSYMDLKEFLENLFHKKVDLVMRSSLKPQLKDRILSEVKYVPGL